ncbi:ABC transporter permease [Streptomyces canus]|uniref:ABC transporter permease n=1 Tax=Streptomyces canus TaxID=58343 RepID=UPI0003705288|nr:ABC transporter permease [Streptomyces canus]
MVRMILRRLGVAAITFTLASVLIFLLVDLAPGDPAKLLAERRYGANTTVENVAQVRSELGLDRSAAERYLSWIGHALRGDFGNSFQNGRLVAQDLTEKVGVTVILILCAAVFALLLGVLLAGLGAWRPGGWIDRATRGVAMAGVSVPMFFLGPLLLLAFALKSPLFPAIGESGPASWVLPAVTLGCSSAAIFAIVTRVLVEEAMTQQYVITSRSVGALPGAVLVRDVLPNIAPQAVTVFLTQVGFTLLPGTTIVETIFAWPGIGDYFLRGLLFRDFPVMQAVLLLFVVVLIVLNLMADLVQGVLDPRVRRSLRKGTT